MEEKVKIYHAKDKKEADKLLVFLKANGIEAERQQLGEGAYKDLYGGNRWYGEEVLVEKSKEQQAYLVVQAFLKNTKAREGKGMAAFGRLLLIGAIILEVLLGGATWLPRIFG